MRVRHITRSCVPGGIFLPASCSCCAFRTICPQSRPLLSWNVIGDFRPRIVSVIPSFRISTDVSFDSSKSSDFVGALKIKLRFVSANSPTAAARSSVDVAGVLCPK